MDYHDWRNAVFNQPIQDLEKADCESEAFTLGLDEALDHIDRALIDDDMYSFKEEQLVIAETNGDTGKRRDKPDWSRECKSPTKKN